MRKFAPLLIAMLLAVLPLVPAEAVQCVAYARAISGIHLSGDAWQWWGNAAGTYARGATPRRGAVLVFARQGHMRHGHVSVVTKVVNSRMVLVDHANWAPARGAGRGKVTQAVPVIDVSRHNDWTRVRVWYRPAKQYGNRIYRTKGFVYDRPASAAKLQTVAATLPAARPFGDHAASRPTTIGLVKVGRHAFHHHKHVHHVHHTRHHHQRVANSDRKGVRG